MYYAYMFNVAIQRNSCNYAYNYWFKVRIALNTKFNIIMWMCRSGYRA